MHPLEVSLDESVHQTAGRPGVPRRRSSLDNSCLGAADTIRHIIPDNDVEISAPRRRLSLCAKQTLTTTFLASTDSRPKLDLDADWHASNHSQQAMRGQKSGHSTATQATPSSGAEDPSESSLESDADSFCDASVQEPANREYLRKDLGASCFWGSADGCGFDFDEINPSGKKPVATQIIAEGDEAE